MTTGVRFHPGELLLSLPIRLAAVVLLGAPLYGVLAFELAFTVANLIEHGDIDYPRRLDAALGRLFVTPSLYRCHHTHQRPEARQQLRHRLLGLGPSPRHVSALHAGRGD